MWSLIRRIMGNDNSKYITELSDDSSESEFEYSLEPRSNLHTRFAAASSITQMTQDGDVIRPISNENLDGVNENGEGTNRDLTTDASGKILTSCLPKPETVLTVDKVHQIEKDLDTYEIVSLVYLLYEGAHYALQELTLFIRGAEKYLIYDWANSENNSGKQWQKKLIEALCIIKNYKILRELGYQKQDIIAEFLPHRVAGISTINKVKKVIYLICEKLNNKQTAAFLANVKLQFEERNLPFESYDSEYLELYFLNWETINYVSLTDMTNVKKILKVMEEDYLYDLLCIVFPQHVPNAMTAEKTQSQASQTNDELKKPLQKGRPSTSTDTQQRTRTEGVQYYHISPQYVAQEEYQFSPPCLSEGNSQSPRPSLDQDNVNVFNSPLDDNRYKIDPENPGILLIINQEYFYTEFDPKFKELLPDDLNVKLEKREGTEKDKEALKNIFERFSFKVITADNLLHEDMVKMIKEVVKSVRNESSLFVCIMSHGDRGVVYGSNSCKVQVSQIQELMCKHNKANLADKPKILILQSCQGRECLRVDEASDEEEDESAHAITTDGPKSVPITVDMLTFWATVPGYAAIRNKRRGSWFIQELCEKMEEFGNRHHFADICTRILDSVSGKTWIAQENNKNVMTPMVVSTLRRNFYFPPMRD